MLELARNDLDVGIVTHRTEKMLRFYGETIGLPSAGTLELPGRGVIHKFLVGTNVVKLFEPETAVRLTDDAAEYPWQRAGLQYWTMHVSDLDPIVDRLDAEGVAPVSGVIDTGFNVRYMLVADPDGNLVEFVEGIPRPRSATVATSSDEA